MRTRTGLLMGLAALMLVAVSGCGPTQVEVPNLVGMTPQGASSALQAAGLVEGDSTEASSGEIPAGAIASQSPAAGTKVDKGAAVDYAVSSGPEQAATTPVPDVTGMDEASAGAALSAAGFDMWPYQEFSSDAKKGEALGQIPAAAAQAEAGSSVYVAFSLGNAPSPKSIPGVVGKTKDDAVKALKDDGFKVTTTSMHVAGAKKGVVVAQVPAKGDKADKSSHVIIMYSSGSPSGKIPNVTGKSKRAAATAISDAGFEPQYAHAWSVNVPKGTVVDQLPAAGSEQLHGADVVIVLSLGDPAGPAAASVPDLSGMTGSQAQKAVKDAGLKPIVVEAHDKSVDKGDVIEQFPAADESAAKGQDVVIEVSSGPLSSGEVKVPSVAKMTASKAQAALQKAGLRTRLHRLYSPTVAAGSVMGQLPKIGDKVLPNARVSVVVSLGKPPAKDLKVPDVVGKTTEDASAALETLGFNVLTSGVPNSETTPPGTVIEQFPTAGTDARAGAWVVLVVTR